MTSTGAVPAFPGAIGVSHLRVYDSQAPDGLRGGTPHVHSVCAEAYAVLAGSGAVQTLGPDGFREIPLEPGAFVWFTPGTSVHRLPPPAAERRMGCCGTLGVYVADDPAGT